MATIIRTLFGFVLACLAAATVLVGFVNTPAELLGVPDHARLERLANVGDLILRAATHSAVFAAPFALIAILIGVILSTRSVIFYLAAGLAISLFGFAALHAGEVPGSATILNTYAGVAYAISGLAGGFIYWLVAGRYCGNEKRTTLPAKQDRTPPPIVTANKK